MDDNQQPETSTKVSILPNEPPVYTAEDQRRFQTAQQRGALRIAELIRTDVLQPLSVGQMPTGHEPGWVGEDTDAAVPTTTAAGRITHRYLPDALKQAVQEGAREVALDLASAQREQDRAKADEVMAVLRRLPDRYRRLLVDALDEFAEAQAEYGEFAHDDLGLASQWEHMYRKVNKLRTDMWAGKSRLTRETPQTVIRDIIGHCLLALDLYERDFAGGRE